MAFHDANCQIIPHIASYFNGSNNKGNTIIAIVAFGHVTIAN